MAQVPQNGDPQLLPKPTITRPSGRRMPYDSRGVLRPGGPEFNAVRDAPDIKGLPYERLPNDEWTTPEQRAEVLEFLRAFFKSNCFTFSSWKLRERDRYNRSPIRIPMLHLFVTRKKDKRVFDAAVEFTPQHRETLTTFRARVEVLGSTILSLHGQNPAV